MNIYQNAISIEEAVELSKQLPVLPYKPEKKQSKPKQVGDSTVISLRKYLTMFIGLALNQ